MKASEARDLLVRIQDTFKNQGMDVPALSALFKELRPFYIETEDPLMTKICRMTYEHLEEHKDFLIQYTEEDLEGVSSFQYLIQLMEDPRNKYNREDLQEFRDYLKLYPEIPVREIEEEEEGAGAEPAAQ